MLRYILTLARVSNLPTVWSNCLAAWILTGAEPSWSILPLLAAASLLYSGGCTLNDAFDAKWDAVHRPERIIPSGRLTRGAVWHLGILEMVLGLFIIATGGLLSWAVVKPVLMWIFCLYLGGLNLSGAPLRLPDGESGRSKIVRTVFGICLIGFGSWGLASAGVAQLQPALGLSAAILLYDAWHKQSPWSVVTMGACRWLLYITAAASAGGGLLEPAMVCGGVVWLYIIVLSLVARGEATRGDAIPRTRWLLLTVPLALAGAGWWLGLRGWDAAVPPLFLLAGGSLLLPHGRRHVSLWVNRLLAAIPWLDFSIILLWRLLHPGDGSGSVWLLAFPAAVGLSLLFQRWFKAT